MSQILAETVIRKALKDIKNDPQRSIRNLVDMAVYFCNGKFKEQLLIAIQEMLENENSAYYDLIEDIVINVDNDRLLQFGMNIGYNSCTLGAKKIRNWELEHKRKISWAVTLKIEEDMEYYRKVISEKEQIGIFTWFLIVEKNLMDVLFLIKDFPESAFIVFCNAERLTEELIDEISNIPNMMIVISYDEKTEEMCTRLREEKILYGVSYYYHQESISYIKSGDLFYDVQALHPAVTILVPKYECEKSVQEEVHQLILETRERQCYSTLAFELCGDIDLIDRIISDNKICPFSH